MGCGSEWWILGDRVAECGSGSGRYCQNRRKLLILRSPCDMISIECGSALIWRADGKSMTSVTNKESTRYEYCQM